MRLVGPDTVLFAIGLFLFLGAGYALVQFDDGGEGGLNTYQVTWTTDEATLAVAEDIGAGASATDAWKVTEGNLTKVTVLFSCTDNNPAAENAPVRFSGEVTAPDGATKTMEGVCGDPVDVSFNLNDLPNDTNVIGSKESAAQDAAAANANTTGTGEWTVTYETARDDASGGVVDNFGGADGSIDVKLERYKPQLTMLPR